MIVIKLIDEVKTPKNGFYIRYSAKSANGVYDHIIPFPEYTRILMREECPPRRGVCQIITKVRSDPLYVFLSDMIKDPHPFTLCYRDGDCELVLHDYAWVEQAKPISVSGDWVAFTIKWDDEIQIIISLDDLSRWFY